MVNLVAVRYKRQNAWDNKGDDFIQTIAIRKMFIIKSIYKKRRVTWGFIDAGKQESHH